MDRKAKMKLKAKMILVEWVDAAVLGSWGDIDDIEVETCFSAGFLVKETKDEITIAAAISENIINAAISIPKVWIRKKKIWKL